MAVVNAISYTIRDMQGDRKSLPIYFPDDTTLGDLELFNTGFAPDLDAVIDGVIESVTVTLALDLPGGLKTDAVVGNTVHEGALLSFDCADTNYALSVFIPSWENAGFSGQVVLATGDYATLQGDFVSGISGAAPSDRYANVIDSFAGGLRKFRK